jgi:hypothetical protein
VTRATHGDQIGLLGRRGCLDRNAKCAGSSPEQHWIAERLGRADQQGRIAERARAERQGADDPHPLGRRHLPKWCSRGPSASKLALPTPSPVLHGGSNLGFLSRRRALRAAIAEIGNAARRAAAADTLPTMSALVAEVEQNGNGVAALSRRVLQTRIAARAAGTVGR